MKEVNVKQKGFTLLELLVVIIIIMVVAGATVGIVTTFFRGQSVRKGSTLCRSAFAKAKMRAASERVMHFIVFVEDDKGSNIQIHRDANGNNFYDGDQVDKQITGRPIQLPKFVRFVKKPEWIGIFPTGYCRFNTSFSEMNSGLFDANKSKDNPMLEGDIILEVENKPYRMCLDIDRGAGRIRDSFFMNQP